MHLVNSVMGRMVYPAGSVMGIIQPLANSLINLVSCIIIISHLVG